MTRLRIILAVAIVPIFIVALGYHFYEPIAIVPAPQATVQPEESFEHLFYKGIGIKRPESEKQQETPTPDKFTVELQQTQDVEKARQLVRQLSELGYEAFYTPVNRQGQVFYRVRYGLFIDQKKAEDLRVSLEKQGFKGAVISF